MHLKRPKDPTRIAPEASLIDPTRHRDRPAAAWLCRTLLYLCVLLGAWQTSALAEDEESAGPPLYLKIHPAIMVNLKAPERPYFLQLESYIMARSDQQIQAAKHHMPAIRHRMIMLFSERSVDEFKTIENKEKMREEALAEVNRVLETEGEPPEIEGLYFTSLVVQ